MRKEDEIRSALTAHSAQPIDEEALETLKRQHPDKSEEYWRGLFEGVEWAYKWVLEDLP